MSDRMRNLAEQVARGPLEGSWSTDPEHDLSQACKVVSVWPKYIKSIDTSTLSTTAVDFSLASGRRGLIGSTGSFSGVQIARTQDSGAKWFPLASGWIAENTSPLFLRTGPGTTPGVGTAVFCFFEVPTGYGKEPMVTLMFLEGVKAFLAAGSFAITSTGGGASSKVAIVNDAAPTTEVTVQTGGLPEGVLNNATYLANAAYGMVYDDVAVAWNKLRQPESQVKVCTLGIGVSLATTGTKTTYTFPQKGFIDHVACDLGGPVSSTQEIRLQVLLFRSGTGTISLGTIIIPTTATGGIGTYRPGAIGTTEEVSGTRVTGVIPISLPCEAESGDQLSFSCLQAATTSATVNLSLGTRADRANFQ